MRDRSRISTWPLSIQLYVSEGEWPDGGNLRCGYESGDCRASIERSSTRIHPIQKFLDGSDRPGIGGDISGQCCDGLVKLAALHNIEHALHRLRFQKSAFTDE